MTDSINKCTRTVPFSSEREKIIGKEQKFLTRKKLHFYLNTRNVGLYS